MSFGYAVGDIIVIGKLAWSVYKSCVDAPASFGNVAQEVIALEVVIRQFGEAFEGQVLSDLERARLEIIGKGCKQVLEDLQNLLRKYQGLGSNAKLSFDRFKWAAAPIDDLRIRLISNTTILSAFVQTSPSVILKHVKKVIQEYRTGKREGSIFSSFSADSLSSNQRTQWRIIRKELEGSGLTLAVLENNRELITEFVTAALGKLGAEEHQKYQERFTKGKEKDKVTPSASLVDQSLISNPFTDSAFQIASEEQVATEESDLNDIVDVSLGQGEEFDSRESSRPCFTQVVQYLSIKSHSLREVGKSSTESRRLPWPSINYLLGLNLDLPDAIRMPRVIDIKIGHSGLFNRARTRRLQRTKILLLGSGETGKSTLLKQMTMFFKGSFTVDEQEEARKVILRNIVRTCYLIVVEIKASKQRFKWSAKSKIMQEMRDSKPIDDLPPNWLTIIKILKADAVFLMALNRSHEFPCYENMVYYFDNLERISQPDYIPSVEDILRSRSRTKFTTRKIFEKDSAKFDVYDLGGARSLRKTWGSSFRQTNIVVFVASINMYDRCLVHDTYNNLMRESLELFQSLITAPSFQKCKIVVLLNKFDRLNDTLRRNPIQSWWPDYDRPSQSEADVVQFFTDKFLSCDTNNERHIIVKAINLIDTEKVHQFIGDELFDPQQRWQPLEDR